MLKAYPAIFYYDPNENVKFLVHFPDFEHSITQGRDIEDALDMASDYLGITLADMIERKKELPTPSTIHSLSLEKNHPFKKEDFNFSYDTEKSFISMVSVDLKDYLEMNDPIKKTLTIPKWADKLGKEHHLNFSQTLTEAILEKSNKRA